ncbi:MAG: hypothetical protein ACRCTZ_15385 [Sarcina sp.]
MIIYLVILSAILILFNIKSLKKEKLNGFSSILKNEEETVSDSTVEMIKLRKDLSETIVELQREIVDLKEEVNYLKYSLTNEKIKSSEFKINTVVSDEYVRATEFEKKTYSNNLNIKDVKKSEELKENNDNKKENENLNRVLEIKKLMHKGLSDDEICKKLSLGKGELLLIKSLYN